jgi:RNA polymerase sigma-70 factor (ECF subfamily)
VTKLRESCWPAAHRYLRSFGTSPADLDDIAQELWKTLLLGHDSSPAKLWSYSGRGSLAGFVGISAQRIALMRFRREQAAVRRADRAAAEVHAFSDDGELAFLKTRYRECFRAALQEALSGLDDRSRIVLRMNLVDGVTAERIGKAYGVAQSTVSRWMAKARETVVQETRRRLAERLRLSESEFDSIWNVLLSQMDISISQIVQPPPGPSPR